MFESVPAASMFDVRPGHQTYSENARVCEERERPVYIVHNCELRHFLLYSLRAKANSECAHNYYI